MDTEEPHMPEEDTRMPEFVKHLEQVAQIFGPIDKLLVRSSDMYAHQVLSHGFMAYTSRVNLIAQIKKQIIQERIAAGDEEYKSLATLAMSDEDLPMEVHRRIYSDHGERLVEIQKSVFLTWAAANQVPENMIEVGWQEYLND